jgi:hypothetical protein
MSHRGIHAGETSSVLLALCPLKSFERLFAVDGWLRAKQTGCPSQQRRNRYNAEWQR